MACSHGLNVRTFGGQRLAKHKTRSLCGSIAVIVLVMSGSRTDMNDRNDWELCRDRFLGRASEVYEVFIT